MKKNLLVFTIFLLTSLIVTYPLIFHLNTLIIDRYDSLLITWIQNWIIHSLSSGPHGWQNILNTNIFYPYQNTLAFSDYHLVSALLALPMVLIFKEPLIAFNLNLLLGLTLTGFSGYLLVFYLARKIPAAILGGVILAFSTLHLSYMPHPQLFHLWLLVLPLLFLIQKRFKLFSLFFFLAVLNSALNLYFLLLIVLLYLLVTKKNIWKSLRYLFASCLLITPFLIPYLLISRTFGYSRPITDAINFSLQFPDLANVSLLSRLSALVPQSPGTPAYFGIVLLVLFLLLLIQKLKNPSAKNSDQESMVRYFLLLAFCSFILALGPALHIFRNTVHLGPIPAIPLPYTLFYFLVPGFAGFRTPSRWILLTFMAVTFAVCLYFAKRLNWKLALALSLLILLEVNSPFSYVQIPKVSQFPSEQIWLENHFPGSPIIQFPIYGWFDGQKLGVETSREYYSTIHWHPTFNGYSGFSPTEWENRVRWLQKDFPSAATIDYLENIGIKLILIPKAWDVSSYKDRLKLVAAFPETKIYAIRSSFDTK